MTPRRGPVGSALRWCALAALALAVPVAAQCGTDPTSQFNRMDALPVAVTFDAPTIGEWLDGWTAVRVYQVEVHPISRDRLRPWFLCLRAEAPTFAGPTGTAKPSGDLEWSIAGSPWTPVTPVAVPITSPFVGRRTIAVSVRIRLRGDEAPGTYGPLPLRFVAQH